MNADFRGRLACLFRTQSNSRNTQVSLDFQCL